MHKRFLPIVTVIIVLTVFLLISCSDEIQLPQKPGIRGRISLPASSELAPEEIWVKAVEGETTKYVGRVNPDGTFLIPNLDSEKKYNIHFTSIEPEFENKRSVGDRAAGRKPYGGWLTDVSASIDASVGSVKMKPLGIIMGTAIRTGAADNYDVMVYIPGTSLMAMTDAEGNFSITNVPQGTHRIRYTSSGYLSLMKEGVVLASDSDDESPTKVVAEASLIREAGIVRGAVTLKGAQSHEGIIIRLEGADPEDVATGTTTEDGAFLIPDVKPGTYSALISYPGHVPQRLEGITVRAAETTSIGQAIALSANGGEITGKIVLNDGKPLSGAAVLATITIDGKRYSFSTTTDAEGTYVLNNCPLGEGYEISITKTGYATVIMTGVSVLAGVPTVIPEKLLSSEFGSINGTVQDTRGNGLSGAQVLMKAVPDTGATYTATTDGAGSFSKSGIAIGSYEITISKDGYSDLRLAQNVRVESSGTATLGIQKLTSLQGSIRGTVSLNDGRTAEGTVISATSGTNSYPATVESDGTYSIGGMLPGSYQVTASKEGYESSSMTVLVVADRQTEAGTLTLASRSGSIKVQVGYGDKEVDDRITVSISKGGTAVRTATTSNSPILVFSGIPVGSGYTVTASAEGYSSSEAVDVVVESNRETSVILNALSSRFGSINGTVQDTRGNGLSGAQVLMKAVPDTGSTYTATTDGAGSFSKSGIAIGSYEITISKDGYSDLRLAQNVRVESSGTATLGIQKLTSLQGSIRGTVSLNDGRTAEGTVISATSGTNSYPATVESDGTYSIGGMLPGSYQVTASKEGYESSSMTVSVVADRQTEAGTLTLASRSGSIKVQVGYGDKEVDDRITVSISKGGTAVRTATTSNSPILVFSGIPVGSGYTVTASAEGYSSSEAVDVVVESNRETSVILNALSSRFGSINGTVQDTRGNGLSGAQVLMKAVPDTGSTYTATTDGAGSFSKSGIAIGSYEITISKDGYSDLRLAQSVRVESSGTATLGIQKLTSLQGSISGMARLQGAGDHTGILVSATGTRSYTASTNADGSYTISGMEPGNYELSFTKAGYVNQTANVAVEADKTSLVPEAILISSSCAITGSVVLEGSPGNSGVTVSATLVGDQGRVVTTTTLEDGTYYIGGLDVGQYSIQIQMNGYVTDRSKLVYTTYGETTVIAPVVLKSVKAIVRGSVTLIGTNVHTGISVMLKTQDNQIQYDATTAQDGAFVITGVQPGIYSLYVSKAGYESKAVDTITIEPSSEKTIDNISLAVAQRSIYGNVQLELRTDHAGALITATKTSDPQKVYSAISNSAGDYSLAGMEPGEYRIVITSAGYRTLTLATTDVTADSTADLGTAELIVARGTISGIVTLEGRSSQEGTKVELLGTGYETLTNELGEYSFSVPSGNYPGGVRFSKVDFATSSNTDTITVLTDSTYAVPEHMIKATHSTITGFVDVEGTNDDSEVEVTLLNTDFMMRTASDGAYLFEHVPLGTYLIQFNRENAPIVTDTVSVVPAPTIIVPTATLLPRQASIHGYATLDEKTNFSNIKVEVKNNDTQQVQSTMTESDGYFYISNILTSGDYTVSFSKEGWDTQTMPLADLNPLENRNITTENPIVLIDTTPPVVGNFTINSGNLYTDNKNVTLHIPVEEHGSGVVSMQLRLNNNPNNPNWIPYKITTIEDLENIWALNYQGNGEYIISVRVKDLAGNISEWVDDSITLTDQITIIKGVLGDGDLYWTKEKSPYRVEGNLLVPQGKVLFIDSGVEIRFAGDYYIRLDGDIRATGTQTSPIHFKSDSDYSGKWKGIWSNILDNSGTPLEFNAEGEVISGTGFDYVCFNDASYALSYALRFNRTSTSSIGGGLSVRNCTFENSNEYSMFLEWNNSDYHGNSNFVIENNTIKAPFDLNYSIEPDTDSFQVASVKYNTFIDTTFSTRFGQHSSYEEIQTQSIGYEVSTNAFVGTNVEFGLFYVYGSNPILFSFTNNYFKDVDNPITLTIYRIESVEVPDFSKNTFDNCSGYLVTTHYWPDPNNFSINFTGTYWGDSATEELEAVGPDGNLSFIYDYHDDFTRPIVIVDDYRLEP